MRPGILKFAASLFAGTSALALSAQAATYNAVDDATWDAGVTLFVNGDTINLAGNAVMGPPDFTGKTSGIININSGTLSNTGFSFGSGMAVTIAGGATIVTDGAQQFGSLAGAGILNMGATGALAFGSNNANTAFSGTVIKTSAMDSLFKVGTGDTNISGMTMSEGFFLVRGGSLTHNAGTSNIKYLAVGSGAGNTGSMTFSGGTMNMTGTGNVALHIGEFDATGTFNQTSGTIQIGTAVNSASYNLGNQGGTGIHNISGGSLILGGSAGGNYSIGRSTTATRNSNGTLNLSGTGLVEVAFGFLVNGDRDAAGAGATTQSTINQSGGTLRVNPGAQFYLSGENNGAAIDSTYNFTGGTLEIGDNSLLGNLSGGGVYQWNINGGTIRVIGSALTTAADVNATLAGAGLTYNTNGLGGTWNGVMSGAGGLTKTGAGTLTLGAAQTYTGATNVNAGTLTATVANALTQQTALTVAAGATFATGALAQQAGSLAGAGTIDTDGVGGGLVFGYDNTNTAFSGTVLKTAGILAPTLVKVGTGVTTINGMTMAEGEFIVSGTGGGLAHTGGTTNVKSIAVGSGAGQSSSLTMNGGTLNITGFVSAIPCGSNCPALRIGDFGGTGTLNQTAGLIKIGGVDVTASYNLGNQGGIGVHNLSGGTLQLGDITDPVDSAGLYSIGRSTSDTRNSNGTLNLSGAGLVDLQAGYFINGDRDAAGLLATTVSTINQTGGTFRVRGGTFFYLSGYNNAGAVDSTYNFNGGVLEIGDGSLVGNYAGGGVYQWNAGGGTIRVIGSDLVAGADVNATLTNVAGLTVDTNGFNATLNGVLSGAGWLNKTGVGTLNLGGVNTYTGGTAFNGGVVLVDAATDLGANSSAMSFNGGTLRLGAANVLNAKTGGTSMVGPGTIDTNGFNTQYNGNITGAGALTKTGTGLLDLFGNNDAHTGAFNVLAGFVGTAGGSSIGNTSAVTVTSPGFLIIGSSETIGSLAGNGSVQLNAGTVLTTGGNNTSTSFTGVTSSTGGLTKVGTGKMSTLSLGHTGLTSVNGGELNVNGSVADGVTVNAGGLYSGNNTITGNLTNNVGGVVAPGNSPGIINVGGNYIGGGALNMEVQFNNAAAPVNGTTHDLLNITGTASNVTTVNILAVAPSNAPVPTTGNGIELVRVGGAHTGGAFVLGAPVVQGGFQYVLNYLANYSGTLDGYFLQSTARQEVHGAAAVGMAAASMGGACSSTRHRIDPMTGKAKEAWVEGGMSSLETGASSGLVSDGDTTCFTGGASFRAGETVRAGVAVRSTSMDSDLVLPVGTATLEGEALGGELFVTFAKDGFFGSAAVGYVNQDFDFNGSVSGLKSADASGMYANLLGGVAVNAGESVRLSVSGILDYNMAVCEANCLGLTGLDEAESMLKGTIKVMAAAKLGHISPYASLAYTDVLSGSANVGYLGASSTAFAGEGAFDAVLGVNAQLTQAVAVFAEGTYMDSQSTDATGQGFAAGLRVIW